MKQVNKRSDLLEAADAAPLEIGAPEDLLGTQLFVGEQVSRDEFLAHRFLDGVTSAHGIVPTAILVAQPFR